jgi:hypothetical protein
MKRYRVAAGLRKNPDGSHYFVRRLAVSAEPIRAHLADLLENGWTVRAITAELGLHRETVPKIIQGARSTVRSATAAALLSLEPLDPVDLDPVVVDRLVAGADWRTLGATRAERIAAAEKAWAMWGPIRRAQKGQGTPDQNLPGESLTAIEDRLGLRAGRDFRREVAA